MKYSPRYVIYLAIINYLRKDQIACFNYELQHTEIDKSQQFLAVVDHYFDINLFKNNPRVRQDVWIHDYLQQGFTSAFTKKGLLAKYGQEVLLPKNIAFNEMYDSYLILGLA